MNGVGGGGGEGGVNGGGGVVNGCQKQMCTKKNALTI
jgi:hypothetical protein